MARAAPPESSPTSADGAGGGDDGARRRFLGRLELRQLVGRTERTMTWRVVEPRRGASWLIALPRRQPSDAAALARWLDHAGRAARLSHPGLRPPVEIDAEEGWPYVAYEAPAGSTTLGQRLRDGALDAACVAALLGAGLDALACAHDAGLVHGDVHPDALWLAADGAPAWLGLGVEAAGGPGATTRLAHARAVARDTAGVGLMLRHALAGRPALDESAAMQVLDRIAPAGPEALPPLASAGGGNAPAALRAIAERATHRRPRLRYASARTMRRAIDGWRCAEADARLGALALFGERLQRFGALPAPGAGVARFAMISPVANDHLHRLAERVAGEPALVLELLRRANLAVGHSGLGGGSVLSPTRALLLLGIDGLRDAALALSRWPGALDGDDDARAAPLAWALGRAQRAAGFARALAPAGYDPAVAMVVAQLQRLGALLLQHHFADEAAQIARLTAPSDPDEAAEGAAGPGLGESDAALSVLGVDRDALAQAVLRRWGFDDDALPLLRPFDRGAPLPQPLARDADAHRLRAAASAANELADAEELERPRRRRALEAIELRYGGLIEVDLPRLAELLADRTPVTLTRPWARPHPDAGLDARSAA